MKIIKFVIFYFLIAICIYIQKKSRYVQKQSSSSVSSKVNILKTQIEAKKDFDSYCRNKWTKRGVLDNEMFNYCYGIESEGYNNIIYKVKNNQYTWFDNLLYKIIQKWTQKGIIQWGMVDYELTTEVDAYLDIEYMKEHNEVSIQKVKFYEDEYKNSANIWSMTLFELKRHNK